MDDLSVMEIFTDADAITPFLSNIGTILSEAGFGVNLSKLEVTIRAFGLGSRAMNKKIRQGQFRLVLRGPTP
eukprot:1687999-Pyramimonas_sp.AAC.1